jgi:PAS domain S-box-containing protein
LLKKRSLTTGFPAAEAETLKLIHELEVHQIELEMQNEELLQTRSEALQTAEKYTELYDFAPLSYFTLSRAGQILELNLCGFQMLEKNRSQLINSYFGFFVSHNSKPIFNTFLEKLFTGKTRENCEVTLETKVNSPKFVHLTGIAIEKGNRCLITAIDISIHKQLEDELKQSEERFRNISTTISDISYSCVLGKNGTYMIDWITGAAERIIGYSNDELKTRGCWGDLVVEEDLNRFNQNVTHRTPGSTGTCELRLRHKDGRMIWVVSYVKCIKKNEPYGQTTIYGALVDITSQKQAEEKLQISEKKYRNLVENAIVGVYSTSFDGTLLYANEAMCKMLEYDSIDDLLRMNAIKMYADNGDRQTVLEALKKTSQIINYGLELKTKSGRIIYVLLNSFISEDVIIGMIMNITDLKNTEQELNAKIVELQRFQNITVGRELTMIGLKKEVNELLRESGMEVKYMIVE